VDRQAIEAIKIIAAAYAIVGLHLAIIFIRGENYGPHIGKKMHLRK
jgi:hypothetical protein